MICNRSCDIQGMALHCIALHWKGMVKPFNFIQFNCNTIKLWFGILIVNILTSNLINHFKLDLLINYFVIWFNLVWMPGRAILNRLGTRLKRISSQDHTWTQYKNLLFWWLKFYQSKMKGNTDAELTSEREGQEILWFSSR